MDLERERIRADLRGVIDGEIRVDETFLEMYSSDASIFQIKPLAVVRPKNSADVVATVQYAAENRIPIHPRGSGTGMAGEGLGRGLVIDFAYGMRRILETGDDYVRVQPGVILSNLNRHLLQSGRIFGPDPATRSVTTMGSVIALDASGSHWPQHGSAKDHILELQVVLANGEQVTFKPTQLDRIPHLESKELTRITAGVAELLGHENDKLSSHLPNTFNQGSGYRVADVLREETVDLCRMMAGSEGTLGIITQAKLRTSLRSKSRGLTLLFFERLESAAKAAQLVSQFGVSACDLLDRRVLSIARETDPRYSNLIPENTEAVLLVEVSGNQTKEVHDTLEKIADRVRRRKRLAFHSIITTSPSEVGTYWELARRMVPILNRLKGNTRPLPFVEDIAVPPAELANFLVKVQDILKQNETTASIFSHAVHGHVHVKPLLNLADSEDLKKLERIADEIYSEVFRVKGSISCESGDGLSRSAYLPKQYGPLFDVFVRIKRIFDPQGILNPGKKVMTSTFSPMELIRPVSWKLPSVEEEDETISEKMARVTALPVLNWTAEEMKTAARSCHGCGKCRTFGSDSRMCPVYRFDSREEASPRAKANILRGILSNDISDEGIASEEMQELLKTCFNCQQCRIDCPSNVDIPRIVMELKARSVENRGLSPDAAMQANFYRWAQFGSRFPRIMNWGMQQPVIRWFLEKTLGLAQQRKVARFSKRTFIKQAARRGLTQPTRRSGRKVLYFVDLYANLFDTQLAHSLISVLDHNHIPVYIHPKQQVSGFAALSQGAVSITEGLARRNIQILAEAVRQGYTIVTTEPSAALTLTREYPHLIESEDAREVSENTRDACQYLFDLHQHGDLELDFKPLSVNVGFHVPCHIRAIHQESYGQELLKLIPGLVVSPIEKGCSGMAITYGLTKENFRSSLRIGWDLIQAMRDEQIQVGATECSACKIQMEQAGGKVVVHPIKILATAYGLIDPSETILAPMHKHFVS